MRIGIDIRPLQSTSAERGIGYYLRGLLAGLSHAETQHQYVLLTIAGRPVPAGIGAGLDAEHVALPLGLPGGNVVSAVRFLRWLNPLHARRRGMRYDFLLRRRWDMQRLARAARRGGLEILHLPSVFEPEYAANVGVNFPCPVVQTVHDLIPEVFPEVNRDAGWPFWHERETGLRSLADGKGRIAAISESARQDTERFVPEVRGRVDVIYNGVDARFAPQPDTEIARVAQKFGLRPRAYVMTNGGIEWRKNLPTALRAVAGLTGEGMRVVVPGRLSEPDKTQVQAWREEAGLEKEQVALTGFVPDDDLPALYAGALALLFPSRYEGFGLPVAEAMRCRCPVVTARNSSLPEVGGDAAVYVDDADSVGGFTQALTQLTQQPQWADALRARGEAWARRFTWDEAAASYLHLYERLGSGAAAPNAQTARDHYAADRL